MTLTAELPIEIEPGTGALDTETNTRYKLSQEGGAMKVAARLISLVAGVALVGCSNADPRSDSDESLAEQIVLRGSLINVDSFSLTRLHEAGEVERVESARNEIFITCMAARGFAEAPADSGEGDTAYELAYEAAALGADAWEIGPPAVRLPDGTTALGGNVAQPDSCGYQALERLGVDPPLHEALRYRVMEMRNEADAATMADDRFSDIYENWKSCSGNDDPVGLLLTLDEAWRRSGCLDAQQQRSLAAIRGHYHAQVAQAHRPIVDGWIELVDTELAHIPE